MMVIHTSNRESTTKGREAIAPLLVALLRHDTVRALTLTDPWAELVAIGAKRLETRSWPPPDDYRGPLAIHVSKRFPAEAEALCFEEPFRSTLEAAGFRWTEPRRGNARNTWQFPLGSVVAVAWLEDVRRLPPTLSRGQVPPEPERSFGNFAPGRFVWSLPTVYRLPQPIEARGNYGLWDWQPPAHFWDGVQARLDAERQVV